MHTDPLPFVVLTGRPGSGKSTQLEALCSQYSAMKPTTSITTRPPRGDERPDEYRFVDGPEFSVMCTQGRLAWVVQPYGQGTSHYGTSLDEVVHGLKKGNRIIILSGDSPTRLRAIAQAKGLEKHLCYIHLETGREEVEDELRRRLIARPSKKAFTDAEITQQLVESRGWDADARSSGLPYYFVDAMMAERIVQARILGIIAHHPAYM